MRVWRREEKKSNDSRFDTSQLKDVDRTEGPQLYFRCSESAVREVPTPMLTGLLVKSVSGLPGEPIEAARGVRIRDRVCGHNVHTNGGREYSKDQPIYERYIGIPPGAMCTERTALTTETKKPQNPSPLLTCARTCCTARREGIRQLLRPRLRTRFPVRRQPTFVPRGNRGKWN
jgi:hypothetical protein